MTNGSLSQTATMIKTSLCTVVSTSQSKRRIQMDQVSASRAVFRAVSGVGVSADQRSE